MFRIHFLKTFIPYLSIYHYSFPPCSSKADIFVDQCNRESQFENEKKKSNHIDQTNIKIIKLCELFFVLSSQIVSLEEWLTEMSIFLSVRHFLHYNFRNLVVTICWVHRIGLTNAKSAMEMVPRVHLNMDRIHKAILIVCYTLRMLYNIC